MVFRAVWKGLLSFALLAEVQARLTSANSVNTLATESATFPQFNFTQPLDHFVDTGVTFNQRFWVSTRHYKSGGPVIVLDGGETSGSGRLSFLDTGIVDILASATNGLGVVLEHRYYGASVPVQNFTTDSLRWLNNEQAAADSANFMANVKFEGIDEDLTAPNTPWIYYGGSYAGARSAHMRVLYPDLVFGAIASSGVTYATIVDWEYFDIIRQFAPKDCIQQIETTINEIDPLLEKKSTRKLIQSVFGLPNVTHVEDFASLLTSPLGGWQDTNWDPAINSAGFSNFCTALGKPNNTRVEIAKGISVNAAVLTYGSYINRTLAARCRAPDTQDDCFGSFDPKQYQVYDLSQTWRLWQFQVCTQWGFFMTAPPEGHPKIISKFNTLDYAKQICKFAYPPGEHFTVPALPNITAVNSIGGLKIAADRLAIIDGQADPWRPNTPHADIAKPRPDTTLRPFKLIEGAVHHWDENGLANRTAEPPRIQAIHAQEVVFVKAWLKDFKKPA
ncbi:peptidase S28 [Panus rudis PR-1116 ss-1]|nr:peptidase S28 [Panus rudis PR-1116 ss-1]